MTKNKQLEMPRYRFSVNLPGEFFSRFAKLKEENFKNNAGSKLFLRTIIIDALDKHLKELGY